MIQRKKPNTGRRSTVVFESTDTSTSSYSTTTTSDLSSTDDADNRAKINWTEEYILDYMTPDSAHGCQCGHKSQFLVDLYDMMRKEEALVCPTCCVDKLGVDRPIPLLVSLNYLAHVGLTGKHHQYRKAFNKMEESFAGLDTDKPLYLRLSQLRRCKAGNQYVVTVVDESKFSVVDHDLESEDEIFNVTDIRTADKKGPLSRLQWTIQNTPY